jgi:hypothetical protein
MILVGLRVTVIVAARVQRAAEHDRRQQERRTE